MIFVLMFMWDLFSCKTFYCYEDDVMFECYMLYIVLTNECYFFIDLKKFNLISIRSTKRELVFALCIAFINSLLYCCDRCRVKSFVSSHAGVRLDNMEELYLYLKEKVCGGCMVATSLHLVARRIITLVLTFIYWYIPTLIHTCMLTY